VLARDEQQAARTVEEIAAASPAAPEPFGVAADVADEAQVRAAAAAVDARWGRVDALISNAGWIPPVTGVLDIEVSDLRQVVDSKAGVNILANVAHRELADRGIRTVALAPGLTDTPGMRASVDEAYVARIAAGYPGGRLGQPEDVVSFAAFLCSDAASHLSGTLLPIRPIGG
jgi:NAD(P)-dependent dehydrogenase (short-subunit alcohol dehydrogenase family)